jgi:hypothetical protein
VLLVQVDPDGDGGPDLAQDLAGQEDVGDHPAPSGAHHEVHVPKDLVVVCRVSRVSARRGRGIILLCSSSRSPSSPGTRSCQRSGWTQWRS